MRNETVANHTYEAIVPAVECCAGSISPDRLTTSAPRMGLRSRRGQKSCTSRGSTLVPFPRSFIPRYGNSESVAAHDEGTNFVTNVDLRSQRVSAGVITLTA